VAFRLANGALVHERSLGTESGGASVRSLDEDALCRIDVRLSSRPGALTVRRLSMLALADDDPAAGTKPDCQQASDKADPQRVDARVSSLETRFDGTQLASLNGHVTLRAPAALANRLVRDLPFEGWVG